MDERKQILSGESEKLTDEDLLKYLRGTLSAEERKQVEFKITGSFESDALDGLKQIKDKTRIQGHVQQINKKLPQILRQKKYWAKKKHLKEIQWTVLAVIILLFLCIMTYVVIKMQL